MRRHIDRVRDADATDECRTYQWLWNRMEDSLKEQQQEANAISIQEVLKKGPTKAKPSNETAGGMLAHKGSKGDKDKGKGQGKNDKDGKGSKGDKGKSKGKDATKTKQDDKTGKKGDKGTGKSDLSSAQKAQMPCIYFAQGKCFREKCPFKHEKQEEQQAAKVKPMPKAGMVALIAATISAATATAVPDVQPTYLDFVRVILERESGWEARVRFWTKVFTTVFSILSWAHPLDPSISLRVEECKTPVKLLEYGPKSSIALKTRTCSKLAL